MRYDFYKESGNRYTPCAMRDADFFQVTTVGDKERAMLNEFLSEGRRLKEDYAEGTGRKEYYIAFLFHIETYEKCVNYFEKHSVKV